MLQAFTLIFAFALLGPPAVAAASDPLLSGYAGPGGGEQSVLGAETLGGGGGSGGGGSSGAGGGAVATNQSLRATAAPAAPQQDTSGATAPTRSKEPHRSSVERGARTGSRTTKGSAATTANTPARPPVVAYPSRSTDGGGVPLLSGGTVVGLLAGVLTLVVLGLGLRRLSSVGPLADDGRTSQVPTA